ncbi:hypothetical protein [Bosea sp. BH3]|uniref:hypothetical protein n=1 Tax=Bosea sp. BH3 TaxID=2871701 RepID=UPI0021CB0E38|nr:hypothetical protein [Bosea sp. BH3]MCU4181744.1 hypothetical protein [Bosea sp. BH3]
MSKNLPALSLGLGALVLLAALQWGASATGGLADARILAAPPMSRPAYLQPVTDPTVTTVLTRVTDPGRPMAAGLVCDPGYCRHRYSSTQAWNADQSLLAITKGCNGFCFLDGQSYEPAFRRSGDDDCKWHPTDPALMICVRANRVYSWAPRADSRSTIYAPAGYTNLQFGPYKGNLSQDGNRLVLRATNAAGALVAFAYDMAERKKYPDIEIATLPGLNDYCGISPSGRYVACLSTKDRIDIASILTVDGKLVQSWTEHHRPGHGDMTVDADGSEVYVGISKSDPDKWHIIKRRLSDGVVTKLAPAGYGAHASTRNINRPGWVFVSYEGTYAKVLGASGYAPFYQEVVALRLDGSGEVRRIAQTRNVVESYIGETHASPSPDGSQVVWSSNWGITGGPVADYVSRLSWPK